MHFHTIPEWLSVVMFVFGLVVVVCSRVCESAFSCFSSNAKGKLKKLKCFSLRFHFRFMQTKQSNQFTDHPV